MSVVKENSKLRLRLELLKKLAIAQASRASGDRGRTLSQVMADVRNRIRETASITSRPRYGLQVNKQTEVCSTLQVSLGTP